MSQKKDLPLGVFFGDKWCSDPIQSAVLKSVAAIFMRASREAKLEEFFRLFHLMWNDRFPFLVSTNLEVWKQTVHRQVSLRLS